MGKLVYDGKSVYEIDEDCLRKKEERERQKEMEWQRKNLKQPPGMICPLSSKQVKYLKSGVDDACISFWSVGIFLCTPFLFIFAYSFVFRNRVFCGYIR